MIHKNFNDVDFGRVTCVNFYQGNNMSDSGVGETLKHCNFLSKQHYIHKQASGRSARYWVSRSIAQEGTELG